MTSSTVTGTATVGSTAHPVTAAIMLPAAQPPARQVIAGATVAPRAYGLGGGKGNYLKAAQTFDGYCSRRLAQVAQKRFEQGTPTATTVPPEYTDIPGCRYVISLKPGFAATGLPGQSAAEMTKLKAFLALLQGRGVVFDACLWQECNLAQSPFNIAGDYIAWCRYYAPAFRAAGVRLAYCIGGSDLPTGLSYYPGDDVIDMILVDYYPGAFNQKITLDKYAPLADARKDGKKVPFGLAEWGGSASPKSPTMAQWDAYVDHIAGFFSGRRLAGALTYGTVQFAFNGPGGSTINDVQSASDFKVPGIQKIHDAVTGSSS